MAALERAAMKELKRNGGLKRDRQEVAPSIKFLWGCEKDAACQKVGCQSYRNGCLFDDIHEFEDGKPFCVKHLSYCKSRVRERVGRSLSKS